MIGRLKGMHVKGILAWDFVSQDATKKGLSAPFL